ncbi:MAG: hypothetical protein MRZ79_25010 [Bacteroidia bacterium]|nr:hypothetical protein [Bacteroidia bacterium]
MKNYSYFLVLLFSISLFACQNTATATKEKENSEKKTAEKLPPPPPPKPKPTLSQKSDPAAILTAYSEKTSLMQGDSLGMLVDPIRHYADSLQSLNEAGKIRYVSGTKNDCSGTFVQLNQYLKTQFPDYTFAKFGPNLRDTRSLVQYYHNLGKLIFIENPQESDSLIRPGAAMFYVKSGLGGKQVITPENMKSLVQHVGVVTEVVMDSTGRVESYALFHGQNSRTGKIGVTEDHFRNPKRAAKPYPYGWYKQQWMAVAPIAFNDSASMAAMEAAFK